jgi:acyl-CoA synthetase (AMP-forming)/AMP-acid ligase II
MNFYDDLHVHGAATALITESGEHITYDGLLKIADGIVGNTIPRTLVFSLCENNVESVAAYLGFLRRRVVPLLLSSTINSDLLQKLLQTYRPAYIWLPEDKADVCGEFPVLFRYGAYALLKTPYADTPVLHENLAQLLTTSGSTGSPMLVRQSYKNIASNAAAIAQYLGITAADRPITTLPMSYSYGLSILNSHFLRGCTVLLTPKSLMDKGFWQMLKTGEATTFGGVPYVYEMLKRLNFKRMDLPSLKTLTQAGGKLDAGLVREFAGVCAEKGIRFFVMYGQTEATARMSYLPPECAESAAGSIGVAIPGGEFWLEDERGKVIEDEGATGELVYRGDNVTLGYASCGTDLAKGDENGGVLRTGDLARRDADGLYYIVGRMKRVLKLFGNRINLEEVEQMIGDFGYSCVCAGVDDRLRIYTSEKDGHVQIKNFIVERTGIHHSGFEVVYIDSIPRNEAGKILYSALR